MHFIKKDRLKKGLPAGPEFVFSPIRKNAMPFDRILLTKW